MARQVKRAFRYRFCPTGEQAVRGTSSRSGRLRRPSTRARVGSCTCSSFTRTLRGCVTTCARRTSRPPYAPRNWTGPARAAHPRLHPQRRDHPVRRLRGHHWRGHHRPAPPGSRSSRSSLCGSTVVPAHLQIHLIVDSYGTHKTAAIKACWPNIRGSYFTSPRPLFLDQPGRAVVRLPGPPDDPPRRRHERPGPGKPTSGPGSKTGTKVPQLAYARGQCSRTKLGRP